MTEVIQKVRDTNDGTFLQSNAITLNSTTSVKIANANERRTFFRVALYPGISDVQVCIKLQPAATDNLIKGAIFLERKFIANNVVTDFFWQMPEGEKYLGEISAQAITAGTALVTVTEY